MRLIFIGLILALGLGPLAIFNQSAAAGLDFYGRSITNPSPSQEQLCQVKVHIRGGGQVRLLSSSSRSTTLSALDNTTSFSCGESIQLQAVPDERWHFVGWENAAPRQARSPIIRTSGDRQLTAVFELAGLTYQTLDQATYDRSGQLVTALPVVPSVLRDLSAELPNALNSQPPDITFWYGTTQKFGLPGTPQTWVNIVGNVADPEQDVASLSYRLNGGTAVPMQIGGDGSLSDKRRLVDVGDFNIDLATADLHSGSNQLVITAVDSLNNQDVQAMTLNFDNNSIWPLPYHLNWHATGDIQDVAHVVDGKWNLVPGGVRTDPNFLGYDRLLALGDIAWSDFQVTVPITVHGLDPAAYNRISVAPALGIILRWEGHSDIPVICGQPKCGWLYPGASSWYDYDRNGGTNGVFSFWVHHNQRSYDTSGLMLETGQSYYWKARATSPAGTQGKFKMKIWKTSDPEPANWLMEYNGSSNSLQDGSILLLAHHVDVTFGDFSICPVSNSPDTSGPLISNLTVLPGQNEATISWTTNEPAAGQVKFGLSAVYTATVTAETACATDHELILPGLNANQEYHFQISSTDIEDNDSVTADATFSTLSSPNGEEIPLLAGWNMISSSRQPDAPLMANVISPIAAETVLVKNGRGDIYWPAFNIDQIGSWNPADGYQIYVNQAAALTITGSPIDPAATPINLSAGYNLISYLRSTPLPVDQALSSISSQLLLATDGEGHVYWPALSINSLGAMQPGKGYKVYLTAAAPLTYPAND